MYASAEEVEEISQEARTTAIGLPAPGPDDTLVSLSTAIHAVFDEARALRLIGVEHGQKFSLAGYEAEEPVITVEGRLMGGKHSARTGDKHVLALQAATGQASASLSFALALVALAVVSKAMPDNFMRALQDRAYGKTLLGSHNRPFAF